MHCMCIHVCTMYNINVCALETKATCKINVEFNGLLHTKKEISWNNTSEIPLQMFLCITKKNPSPELKWKLILKKKSWRIWVDHHNWINMLQKLQATSTSFLSWQLSFGILQTKHKWFDCNMWNIWPSYPWQSIRCRGDLITVVKFITASLIQRTNKKTQELLPQNQRRY